jgi:hypothetical protein
VHVGIPLQASPPLQAIQDFLIVMSGRFYDAVSNSNCSTIDCLGAVTGMVMVGGFVVTLLHRTMLQKR